MTASLTEQLVADRTKLRLLSRLHPDWPRAKFREELGRSLSWIKNWLARFRAAPPQDQQVLWGRSRRPKTPPPPPDPRLLDRLLELRTNPPAYIKRVPGPKTLSYLLQNDQQLKEQGITPPRSTSTIYKLLVRLGCFARPALKETAPLSRAEPLESIAIDFKDCNSIEVEPDGKKQHLVEILNMVDEGTSVLWAAIPRTDFNAETVVETLLEVFENQGCPRQLRFDRDPRFVGSHSGRDFPAAMVRMLYVLGITPVICPPHQPQKNGFVERYNRSFKYECLLRERPESLGRVREVTAQYKEIYNYLRPHQGKSCKNQPPRVAFKELPALPSLPLLVDPDKWLTRLEGEHFARKVRSDGSIALDKYNYYVGTELSGKYVMVTVAAATQELVVERDKEEVKRFKLKGLYRQEMSLEQYREVIKQEARSERRGWRAPTEGGERQS